MTVKVKVTEEWWNVDLRLVDEDLVDEARSELGDSASEEQIMAWLLDRHPTDEVLGHLTSHQVEWLIEQADTP